MKSRFGSVRMSEQTVKGLPLQGRRVLITRAYEQAGTFSSQLSALGAIPVEFPTIRVVATEGWEHLDNALKRLCEAAWYDWLVFTSANGVRTNHTKRSEEHTSELQSLTNLVCRLLLEKKNKK